MKLVELVHAMNVETAKLCRTKGMFLFNFVPKNHDLYHLGELRKQCHLSWLGVIRERT